LRISLKLSSSSTANESSGITTVFPPKCSHRYRTPKNKQVVNSRGLARYHGVVLLLAMAKFAPRGDIIPKVSIEMRRIPPRSCSCDGCGDEDATPRTLKGGEGFSEIC
jgi:hypothetical protein